MTRTHLAGAIAALLHHSNATANGAVGRSAKEVLTYYAQYQPSPHDEEIRRTLFTVSPADSSRDRA